jgi:hypothetical protein
LRVWLFLYGGGFDSLDNVYMLSTSALTMLIISQIMGGKWQAPEPTPRSDNEVWCWFRYAGDGEDDLIGSIIRIERSGRAADTVIIRLIFSDPGTTPNSTTPNEDFVAPPALIIIPKGQRWIDVRIPYIDDDKIEAESETTSVTFEIVGVVAQTPSIQPTSQPSGN